MSSSSQPIFHALIARGTTVLAEYTPRTGNFPTVTRTVLTRLGARDTKASYAYDGCIFNVLIDDGIVYMCLTDESDKHRRIAFAYLEDVKTKFRADYGERVHSAIAFSMNSEFQRYLHSRMDHFNDEKESDAFGRVNARLEQVKGVMVENIDKVLQRGEKIELLVDKSDALQRTAHRFKRDARTLERHMWWKNVKIWLFIILLLLVVAYIIVGATCGWGFECASGKAAPSPSPSPHARLLRGDDLY
jgi:vesicle-associated membrane protein 7